MSGIEVARQRKQHIRVLTLTSGPSSPSDIHASFEVLVKRIRRKFGRFEYLAVEEHTREGLLHLHLLAHGTYIPQDWLSDVWQEIHGAPVVWIARLFSFRLASHLARYLVKEGAGARFWTSWGFVFRGFVGFWRSLVHRYQDRALFEWKLWLSSGAVPRLRPLKQLPLAVL
jgi:hypothetical protein